MPNTHNNLKNNILIAPLNWGLGHATRCIPIIRALLDLGFNPIIASDGMALTLLQKEFPTLNCLELPSYKIEYPAKESDFKFKMLQNMPDVIEAMLAEKKLVKKWVSEYNLKGIISDSRLGVYSKKVPSVFITHQLNVLSGNTSWLTSSVQRLIIKKFDECWVPDTNEKPTLSGKLGHLKTASDSIKYLGPLSRMTKTEVPSKYKLMVLLSGPEPQRSILEEILINDLKDYTGKTIFIKGIVQEEEIVEQVGNCTFYNFMTSEDLEQKINESEMLICRSGYTTIMDLAKLQKKALLIPTPGQYEQEYLAKRLFKQGRLMFVKQEKFKLCDLEEVQAFSGLPEIKEEADWKNLFCLFEGE
ncbi:MAG: glycosyltransferase [Flavobacterium sp.]